MEKFMPDLPHELLGRRFMKIGDDTRTWIVSALKPADACGLPYAVMISEGDLSAEEVNLAHLSDSERYVPDQRPDYRS